ncbi:MAG: Gfo/Idh/MocA family oxidoreductase [Chloroflexota bacterium]
MSHVLRIGVLGLGRAGAHMLAAFAVHPDIQVAAAADLHQVHRDRFASEFGGPTYSDAADLCASDAIDAIYVATPHEYHAEHVEMAAAHGKHVLVEKPIALTLDECDRMIAATQRAGVAMIVGPTASFNPGVATMRRMIASGQVGPLAMISATAYTDFLYRPRRPEELNTELGGGIIYNQVPHQVDAARLLAGGMAHSVRGATWVLDPTRPTEGCYLAFIDFDSGAAATLVYSGYDHLDSADLAAGTRKDPQRYGSARRALSGVTSAEQEVALRVDSGYGGGSPVAASAGSGRTSLLQSELGVFIATCRDADLQLAPNGVMAYSSDRAQLVDPSPWRGVPGRGHAIDELYYAVTQDRPAIHDGRWAKATLEVCLALLQSARERREIPLRFQVPTQDPAPSRTTDG